MSLDVSITGNEIEVDCECSCGNNHKRVTTDYCYSSNITHNLGKMASEAGIYEALWRPEEINCKYAKDIINLLEVGLADLKKRPKHFEQFNAENGWGLYKHFVPFVEEYLQACKENPEGILSVSR